MKHTTARILKVWAMILTIALIVPILSLSAGAADAIIAAEPQVITDTLKAVMEENTEETTRVAIWLSDIDTDEALATASMPDAQARLAYVQEVEANSTAPTEIDRSIEVKRAALNLCYEPYTADVGADHLTADEIVYCSRYLPIVIADLSDERIATVANLDVVESIDYYCDDVAENQEISTSSINGTEADLTSTTVNNTTYYSIYNNLQFVNAASLSDSMCNEDYVAIGVLDEGGLDTTVAELEMVSITRRHPQAQIQTHRHPNKMMDILATSVPYAQFYYTTYAYTNADGSSNEETLAEELEWLIECGVNIVSISLWLRLIDRGEDDRFSEYQSVSKLLDKYVYVYNIHIIKSAGNYAASGVGSGGMAYNVLTVGNWDRSVETRYIESSYNNNSTGAYKPDISTPGGIIYSDNTYGHSTSNATAFCAAVIALAMVYQPMLKTCNSSLLKAIVTASTLDSYSFVPGTQNYREMGAGVIDAAKIIDICTEGTYYSSLASGTIGAGKERTVNLSRGDVRLSMAFEKINTSTSNRNYSLGDLNLILLDPDWVQLKAATTSNNNVEIIDYDINSSDAYNIMILTVALSTYNSSTALPRFAIAWTQ